MLVRAIERKPKRRERPWNRCDDCGRFIPMADFDSGAARRVLVSDDTAFSSEAYETLCKAHRRPAS